MCYLQSAGITHPSPYSSLGKLSSRTERSEAQITGLAPVPAHSQVTLSTAASPLQTWEGTGWETMCLGRGWMEFLVSSPYSQLLPPTRQPKGTRCDCSTPTTHQVLQGGIISSHGLSKLLMCGFPLTTRKTNGLVKGSRGSGKYCTLLCITKCRHNNTVLFFLKPEFLYFRNCTIF